MLRNYLRTSLRSLLRHRLYAFINISGVSLGLACCLMTFLYVRNEYSVNAAFSDVDASSGQRRYDEDLVSILKLRNRTFDGYTILKELGIDPRDSEAVKLVGNQLESLKRFGLAEETANGWRWKE